MARGNLQFLRGPHVIQRYQVASGSAASIKAGEPVVRNTYTTQYAKTPYQSTVTSGVIFLGISATDSTDTASADGVVYVIKPTFGTIFRGDAKTGSSLAASQEGTKVVLDLTSSKWTVDESTTTNGLALIQQVDTTNDTVDFSIDASTFDNA